MTSAATYFVTPEASGMPYRVALAASADGWVATVERGGERWTFALPPAPDGGRVWVGERLRRSAWQDGRLVLDGVDHPFLVESEARSLARHLQAADLAGRRVSEIRAPMPGLVVAVEVEEGSRVEKGQGIVLIEAMKMENEITAPASGVVRDLGVLAGHAVERDALVCRIVPEDGSP